MDSVLAMDRNALLAHLIDTGLAGDTATPRDNAVRHAEQLAADDRDKHLGIGRRGRDAAEVMRAVASLCGTSGSLAERDGPGVIDPDRTLDELDSATRRLEKAAAGGERVLFATGHPTALTPAYGRIAAALEGRGATLLEPREDERLDAPGHSRYAKRSPCIWRFFDGVGVFCVSWSLVHTHEAWPMDRLLDEVTPDLVVADHGFAGTAAARGIDTIAFTDVNDPAIAVGWEDGMFQAAVPLDDNLRPSVYLPLAASVIAALDR